LALIPESSTHNKTNDSHAHVDFKEILKEKVHKNKVIKKVKNPLFVLICKLIFYLICLVSLYILGRKILEKYGFIIIPENENENKSSNNSRNGKITTEEIPLKTSEMTEVKNQVNKND